MKNETLLGKVLGETAVITVALKAAVIAHPTNAAMIDAVAKRLMGQVR